MTITELNESAKSILESHFGEVEVSGEISRITKHASGHWYFTLKDAKSVINAAMFRADNAKIAFNVIDGLKVTVRGKLTIFAPSGSYQIVIKKMSPLGAGELEIAFNELKERLAKEGLFDASHKKDLPRYPKRVAIITSATSAAFQDMINRIKESGYFLCEFKVFDSLMQGEFAASSVKMALESADKMSFDIIIIARGGGSREDLWCFNDENLARAIYAARTPVISAIGHEIDYSISDFVADHRSITPTAAIDDLLPDISDLIQFLDSAQSEFTKFINAKTEKSVNSLDQKYLLLSSKAVKEKLNQAILTLENKELNLNNLAQAKLNTAMNSLAKKETLLEAKKQFFDASKDLVSISKNGEKISLESLQIGDKIQIYSQTSSKVAQITE